MAWASGGLRTGRAGHRIRLPTAGTGLHGGFRLSGTLLSQTLPVIASELFAAQGFHALIGRDILSQCVFMYNGNGFFTLAY